MNPTSAAPAADRRPRAYRMPARAPYEIRPLRTGADRAAAAALVQDRALWLSERGITLPHHHLIAYRDGQAEAAGLFEVAADGEELLLIGCLLLHRRPEPGTEITDAEEPWLRISLAYSAPSRSDAVGSLITLWAGDYAARTGAATVRGEAPARHPGGDATAGRLLDHLASLGWLLTGAGNGPDGERVARLELRAQACGALAEMIHCTLPLYTSRPALHHGWPR